VGPFDFFLAPRVKLDTDTSALCGLIKVIDVANPVSTSSYTWSTPDGHISSYNSSTSINIDSAGTYIITQRLQSGCPVYATDTVVISTNPFCFILQNPINDFAGRLSSNQVLLNWSTTSNKEINYFVIERSTDGSRFTSVNTIRRHSTSGDVAAYSSIDNVIGFNKSFIYYRLKTVGYNGQVAYSEVIKLFLGEKDMINIIPNPVKDVMRLNISSSATENLKLYIYDLAGRQMMSSNARTQKGNMVIEVKGFQSWPRGIYSVKAVLGNTVFTKKMVLIK
jgi:hypothetical protein